MKILITGGGSGGHVSPALAVAERIRQQYPDAELLYVGGRMAMAGSAGPSLEEKLVSATDIPLRLISSGKLQRDAFNLATIRKLWGFVPGIFQAIGIVRDFRPDVVFSSGGYVSLPVAIAAWLWRIPLVVHEQTAAVGLANALAGKLATRVGVTFAESARYFASRKVVLTGNPIQPAILTPDVARLESTDFGRWLAADGPPIVYVTGGGLGSHKINLAVEEVLKELLTSYRVVHQCGSHAGFADFARLQTLARALPADLSARYRTFEHIAPVDVGLIYQKASVVVARAGANTVLELAAHGLPAVLVPIPWVTHDEQTKNAQILYNAGTGMILPERELNGQCLIQAIAQQLQPSSVSQSARQRARQLVDREATAKLVSLIMASRSGER